MGVEASLPVDRNQHSALGESLCAAQLLALSSLLSLLIGNGHTKVIQHLAYEFERIVQRHDTRQGAGLIDHRHTPNACNAHTANEFQEIVVLTRENRLRTHDVFDEQSLWIDCRTNHPYNDISVCEHADGNPSSLAFFSDNEKSE
jgi:hypothetical protein